MVFRGWADISPKFHVSWTNSPKQKCLSFQYDVLCPGFSLPRNYDFQGRRSKVRVYRLTIFRALKVMWNMIWNIPQHSSVEFIQWSCWSHNILINFLYFPESGDVYVWGYGKACGSRKTDILSPQRVCPGRHHFVQVSGRRSHSLALTGKSSLNTV